MANEKNKGLNTNSNAYTIIYSACLVIIVAFLLAFVYQSLKEKQEANVALDKKKQILYSLNIRGLSDEEAAKKYNEVVLSDVILNDDCQPTPNDHEGAESNGFLLNSADYKDGNLVVYFCRIGEEEKFVVPVYGMGLWGPINGYIAVNADGKTIYGAYFNHESETAGLGAEIKDSQAWQELFKGKQIYNEDGSVALSVEKNVTNPASEVDAVTGATLTSNGVRDMLHEGFAKYAGYFKLLDNSKEE